ncbi:class I SAM-dependent methyltransferase [Patescibacteria group bacterium]|nr:class I SAM-dependent methyltransferase [Patescibacteria group bacterium]
MRIQYRHPKLYDFLISFLYGRKLLEKFRQEVGKNHSVFDVAAGYGRMVRFIDSSNRYVGIDRNEIFVNYGKKNRLELEVRDIFDSAAYKRCGVFIVVDVIHHLTTEKLQNLFDLIFRHVNEKVVIIEPSFVSLTRRYGILGKFLGWIFQIVDDDGFNKITRWLSDEEYQHLFQSRFGSQHGKRFTMKHQKLDEHHLVTFTFSA